MLGDDVIGSLEGLYVGNTLGSGDVGLAVMGQQLGYGDGDGDGDGDCNGGVLG